MTLAKKKTFKLHIFVVGSVKMFAGQVKIIIYTLFNSNKQVIKNINIFCQVQKDVCKINASNS